MVKIYIEYNFNVKVIGFPQQVWVDQLGLLVGVAEKFKKRTFWCGGS